MFVFVLMSLEFLYCRFSPNFRIVDCATLCRTCFFSFSFVVSEIYANKKISPFLYKL